MQEPNTEVGPSTTTHGGTPVEPRVTFRAAEAAGNLKVFVSYARADLSIATDLVSGLERAGFEILIDQHSISGGDDWQKRLGDLILGSDTVVFLLSPDALSSTIVEWEVARAIELSKRILPVVIRPVEFSDSVPAALKKLQAIPMDAGRAISGIVTLIDALRIDFAWLKRHTRIAEMAEEWNSRDRAEAHQLRGSALAEAKAWLEARPKNAPTATELQRQYIAASDEAEVDRVRKDRLFEELVREKAAREEAQKRATFEQAAKEKALEGEARAERKRKILWRAGAVGLSCAAILLATLASMAEVQRREAMTQREIAVRQHGEAIRLRVMAEQQQREAIQQRDLVTAAKEALDAQKRKVEGALNDVNRSLCKAARQVTNVLSTTSDTAEWDISFGLFWTLYWGPMIALERLEKSISDRGQSDVEKAMMAFGDMLGHRSRDAPMMAEEARKSGFPRVELSKTAIPVAEACSKFTGQQ